MEAKIKRIWEESEIRLNYAIKQNELGADNSNDVSYWRGYRDAVKRINAALRINIQSQLPVNKEVK